MKLKRRKFSFMLFLPLVAVVFGMAKSFDFSFTIYGDGTTSGSGSNP